MIRDVNFRLGIDRFPRDDVQINYNCGESIEYG